jgi:hypothetical protein
MVYCKDHGALVWSDGLGRIDRCVCHFNVREAPPITAHMGDLAVGCDPEAALDE